LNGELGVGLNVLILYRRFCVQAEGNSFICIVAFHIALLYWVVGQPDPKRDEVDMTQFLPPNLLALFAPRDPIPYIPPPDKLPHEKKNRGYVGVGCFLHYFEVSWFSLALDLFTFGVVYDVQGLCRRKDVNIEPWVMCVIIICLTQCNIAMTAHQLDEARDMYCDVFIVADLFTMMRVQNQGNNTC
jgi:hypothetical protein